MINNTLKPVNFTRNKPEALKDVNASIRFVSRVLKPKSIRITVTHIINNVIKKYLKYSNSFFTLAPTFN